MIILFFGSNTKKSYNIMNTNQNLVFFVNSSDAVLQFDHPKEKTAADDSVDKDYVGVLIKNPKIQKWQPILEDFILV